MRRCRRERSRVGRARGGVPAPGQGGMGGELPPARGRPAGGRPRGRGRLRLLRPTRSRPPSRESAGEANGSGALTEGRVERSGALPGGAGQGGLERRAEPDAPQLPRRQEEFLHALRSPGLVQRPGKDELSVAGASPAEVEHGLEGQDLGGADAGSSRACSGGRRRGSARSDEAHVGGQGLVRPGSENRAHETHRSLVEDADLAAPGSIVEGATPDPGESRRRPRSERESSRELERLAEARPQSLGHEM